MGEHKKYIERRLLELSFIAEIRPLEIIEQVEERELSKELKKLEGEYYGN